MPRSKRCGGRVITFKCQWEERTCAADTNGFHLDNVVINTTASASASAHAIAAYRTQELDLESLYLLGNANQTGMTLDGTGNYTGGTFYDNHISGFQTAVNGVGHQASNSASTDWLNASTFMRLHIDCPTTNGNPISGTIGVNLQQGDGNTIAGGDVENCGSAVHLGANADNNTIVGLRNENSIFQVVADPGSSYNSWMTGGTMFTGKLTDNGTRNSFLDTFHRSFNSLNGDWYGSQQDATLTNHLRLGIGSGNERGLLDRYQTDYGYRWTMGLSDATGGEQFYQVLDELNNVSRFSIGQYNNGQPSTNNQTVINSAGTGAVVLNGSSNAGTGGVVFGSGGSSANTVATVSNSGNAQFNGAMQVGGTTQSAGTVTVRNNADAEVDYYLWPGITTSQKGSYTYKDYNGNSQWYMVKDASNNWALNSATGGLDSFKAYQSTNSGDTYINSSNASGVVRVNYETGTGSAFNVYGGSSSNLYASFSGNTSIKFPGLSASSGHNCIQIDSSGYITNTGTACGTGSGTVNNGANGQIAYYTGSGTAVSGINTVPVSAGGTGATTADGALATLGGVSLAATTAQNLAGPLNASVNSQINVMAYGAKGNCTTDDHDAIMAAQTAALSYATGGLLLPAALYFPKPVGGCYLTSPVQWEGVSLIGQPGGIGNITHEYPVVIRGKPGQDILFVPDPSTTTFTWHGSWSIKDITFQVDGTSAATTAHRWPGKWFDDVSTTNGSPVIKTIAGELSCGDVGQAIQINGTNVGGAGVNQLVATIASVAPCWAPAGSTTWQVITLSANAQATLTNAHAYVSVLGLPVTTTIGNCAIAFDMKDGQTSNWVNPSQSYGSTGAEMNDVSFIPIGGSTNNHCGIYTQGGWGPYQFTAQNVNFYGQTFGVVEGTAELNSAQQSSGGDYEKWDHVWMFGDTYPWISYNGGENTLTNWELSTLAGPQILVVGANSYDTAAAWHIEIPEFETSTGTPTGYGFRIEGGDHIVMNTSLAGPGTTAQIDGHNIICTSCGGRAVTMNGANNTVDLGGSDVTSTFTDNGRGNKITGVYNASGGLGGMQNNYVQSLIPYKGESQVSGRVTADSIFDGNYSTPYNHNDLLIWPQDFVSYPFSGATPYTAFYVPDPASPSGAEWSLPNTWLSTQFAQFTHTTSSELIVGTNLPASKSTVSYMAKCPSGINSLTFQIRLNDNSTYNDTETCSTTLQTYSFVADFSAKSGKYVGFISGTANPILVAWVSIRPFLHDVNGLTFAGVGTSIATGPNSGTATGHAVCYLDTVGTQGDCGTVPGGSGLTGQTSGYLPKATSATGSTASSAVDDGVTYSGALNVSEPTEIQFGTLRIGIGRDVGNGNINIIDTYNSSGGQATLGLVGGNANAATAVLFELYNGGSPVDYWREGMTGYGTTTDYAIHDDKGGKTILDFPSNTMPANSLGGNANGATAITQVASDNSTNIATDAFVKSNLPLSGTTGSIGGSALALGACASGTVSVTGATTSMAVMASPTTYPGDGMVWRPYVSAAGTVTVKVCAAVAGTPTASTYNVRVIP